MEAIQENTDYRKFGNHVSFVPAEHYRSAIIFAITTCPVCGKQCTVPPQKIIEDYEYSDALKQGLTDIDFDNIPSRTICANDKQCSSCKLRTTK